MEPLAEHRYTLTKQLFYEGMLRTMQESYGKTAKKLVLLLAGLWLLFAAVTLLLRESFAFVLVEFAALGLIALWLAVYLPRNKARRAFRHMQEHNGGGMERTTRFYDDHLVISVADTETRLAYGQISQILHSPRLLILIACDKTGVMLTHDGFVQGSEDAILTRIRSEQAEN